MRVYEEEFVKWLAMEFTLGEEGNENVKKVKDNEKSDKIMGLRSTENKITRGRESKELEAGEWESSSMG